MEKIYKSVHVLNELASRYMKLCYKLLGLSREKRIDMSLPRYLLSAQNGNDLIRKTIIAGKPSMIGRLGFIEANAVINHLEKQQYLSDSLLEKLDAKFAGLRETWDPNVKSLLQKSAGVFPIDDDAMDAFSRTYLEAINASDYVGIIGEMNGENYLCKRFASKAIPFRYQGLEPYLHNSPWTCALKGKKVLIIHPFEATIRAQYQKKELLFKKPDILPTFHLITIRAVQSMQDSIVGYTTWHEALQDMQLQMSKIEYDVCIVGAGAYGLPLCKYAKDMGKISIYLGGATQILFGIRGVRWEKYIPQVAALFNEHWVRPTESERPPGYTNMEGACYW